MRFERIAAIAALVAGLMAPIGASAWTQIGSQYVFGFETSSDSFGLPPSTGLQTNFTCACSIVAGTVAYPAVSSPDVLSVGYDTQTGQYDFTIAVFDPLNISWPALGAYVTGAAAVTANFYAYNYDTLTEDFVGSVQTAGPNDLGSGGTPNTYLGFTDETELTLAVFSSSQAFTLDDVTLGLPDVGPGIPEPATWALMLVGFGAVGAALRRRPLGARGRRTRSNTA
jgi:hypothetical protein